MRCISMRKMRKNKGLTLIELVIVSAMLAVISLAVYAVFSNGMKIWQRAASPIAAEDVDIFLDKFRSDVMNSFSFKDIDFLGEDTRIEFPAIVYSPRMGKRTVGQVSYFYEPSKERIVREERDFSHIYDEDRGNVTQALTHVESLTFQYRFYNAQAEEYVWVAGWEKEGLPVALRIELEFNDGAEVRKVARTIDIPCSGSL